MYVSESVGRHFWVDEEDEFRSAPSFIDHTADMDNAAYVSDWEEWEGVNFDFTFSPFIGQNCLNKWNYADPLSHTGVS